MSKPKKFPASFWQQYAARFAQANREEKRNIIKEIVRKTNRSRQNIYKNLNLHNLDKTTSRKPRADAGKTKDPRLPAFVIDCEKIYNTPVSVNDNTQNTMPLSRAISITHSENKKVYKGLIVSESWMAQQLRRRGTSKAQIKKQKPSIRMYSPEINYTHQLDSSVCRWYMDETENIIHIGKGDLYRNKMDKALKRKTKIIRWVIVDHLSNAFYVQYFRQEQSLDVAEFLWQAWAPGGREEVLKDERFIFHGIPRYIIMDNDTALRSYKMLRLLESYLKVKVPNVKPYNARVKGSVEGMMRIWENHFESGLLFKQPKSLDELNSWALEFAIQMQKTKRVARHGETRFQKWNEITREQLRELPDYATYQSLLHSEPESRVVNSEGVFKWNNVEYKLDNIDSTKVDVTVHPYLFGTDGSLTVQWPSRELNENNFKTTEIKTMTVLPWEKDLNGVPVGAVMIGTYGEPPIHERQVRRDKLEEHYKENGRPDVNPFAAHDKAGEEIFLPKKGETIEVISEVPIGERVMDEYTLRSELIRRLNRGLEEHEIIFIDNQEKTEFTDTDLDNMVELFKDGSQEIETISEEA